jgi:NADH pyrophosphatase NudC (nudix superfamily)
MATTVTGYPQSTSYCPNCGTLNIDTRDNWDQDGLMVCKKCDCRCYIILARGEDD